MGGVVVMYVKTEAGSTTISTFDDKGDPFLYRIMSGRDGSIRISAIDQDEIAIRPASSNVVEVKGQS